MRPTHLLAVSYAVARAFPFVALATAVMVFLSIALHQLNLPGLYYDESLDLVPMMQLMHGESVPLLRGIGIASYPVMLMDYMGSLNGYLSLPFLALLGPGVVAARLQPILFSALTLVLAFALARAWFGRGVAAVTVLLLAINPSFVWFSRQGISVTSVMTVFSLGSLLLAERWRQQLRVHGASHTSPSLVSPSSRKRHPELLLFLAGLLLGLGLWAKILFLWWIMVMGAIALVWVLLEMPAAGRQRSAFQVALRTLWWVVPGLLLGAAPLIYYNLHDLLGRPFDLRNAYTAGLLFQSLNEPTQYGVNNLDLLGNLRTAIADFDVFLDGSYFWYNGVPFSNIFAVPTFVLSAIFGSVLAFRRPEWRKWVALLAAIVVTVAASAFTVSGFWATHLFIILPLPQMVVAAAAVWLSSAMVGWAGRRTAWLKRALGLAMVCLLLAVPAVRDVWVSLQHHATLARTGGSGRFSDAVYELAAHLDSQGIVAPIALDWGIEKSVRVLTADRVRPEEIFGFSAEPDDTFRQRARELLRDPSHQYIVLWDRFAVYNRRRAFTQIAKDMGLQVTETFIAHERSGLPVYVMLQAN